MEENKRLILLIDNEVDFVETLAYQIMAKKGYEVVIAYNGIEGLQKLNSIKPDIIVLDMNMPKMGGIEFYKNICDPDGKTTYPILVLTARANLEQLFKDLNVDGFMTKPFEFEDLFYEMDIIMARRSKQQDLRQHRDVRKSKSVLIVEEEERVFEQIAIAFLRAGYIVNYANNSIAAIEKALVDFPDIIVMRFKLPGMTGDLIFAKLKQMPKVMHIELIVYTLHVEDQDYIVTKKVCQKSGIKNVLKYDHPNNLLAAASILLRNK